MNTRLLGFVLVLERLNQMEQIREREGHREKQRGRSMRQYLCLTDERRGRTKIIVDRTQRLKSIKKGRKDWQK